MMKDYEHAKKEELKVLNGMGSHAPAWLVNNEHDIYGIIAVVNGGKVTYKEEE